MKKATIGLSIIVKNEEKVLPRLLESIHHILDYYVIIDTGSTDNTKKIAEEFMASKGVPGEVIDHEWVDFGTARNFACEMIKGKASHGFWIDADEYLEFDDKFDLESLKANLANFDQASVEVHYNTTRYTRSQFWRTDLPFYWYGPVHEVLMCDQPTKMAVLKGFNVVVKAEGNSWTSMTQQEKYERDAKLLEEYVANDPKKDPRWVFYLAQSYRDAVAPENLEKSIEWYGKRRDMNSGYFEERYYSQLMVSTLKAKLGNRRKDEIFFDYMSCTDFDPLRGEHYIPLIRMLHQDKRYQTAYVLSSHCYKTFHKKNPYPGRSLFIDPETYAWKFADLHAISAFYCGHKAEAKKAMQQAMNALNKGLIQEPGAAERLKGNLQFFKS